MDAQATSIEPIRVERLFDALLTRDGAGGSWLAALLQAAPRGPEQLGDLAAEPGWLEVMIAVRAETGRRGAFEHPAAPTRRLLGWYIDHPDALSRPADETASAETVRLRRALLDDDPPGARARAQDRARHLLGRSTSAGRAWWRFEEAHAADCVLMTDRLLILVTGGDPDAPATPWFPERTARVRDLEAAQRFADGSKAWGVLRLTDADAGPDQDRSDRVVAALRVGAPHLDDAERAQLADGDLGELSYEQAMAATGAELSGAGAPLPGAGTPD